MLSLLKGFFQLWIVAWLHRMHRKRFSGLIPIFGRACPFPWLVLNWFLAADKILFQNLSDFEWCEYRCVEFVCIWVYDEKFILQSTSKNEVCEMSQMCVWGWRLFRWVVFRAAFGAVTSSSTLFFLFSFVSFVVFCSFLCSHFSFFHCFSF